MFDRFKGIALALIAPLVLVGCAFSPGKFVSSLTILADRSFTFSYQGEVIAVDIAGEMAKGMGDAFKSDDKDKKEISTTALLRAASWQDEDAAGNETEGGMTDDSATDAAEKQAEKDAKFKAIAEALTKEAGYRKVEYRGEGVFLIDYQISGKLTHAFLWPFNVDAEVIFPFVVVEMRGRDQVRLKAPAFGDNDSPAKGKGGDSKAKLDGMFTLVTDGEIVSQNNEDGAKTEGVRKTVTWKATPLSKDAPMAVVKVAPLP
ncbi:hypothetical protein [Sphingomonas sp. LT1P40]|uniref:hypothetical protein n=1 Tax=Alteristakelama amylovorans TaxID=3096166 RepID=UPI002FCB490A